MVSEKRDGTPYGMNPDNEHSLLQRAQRGDREALGALWDLITPKLFGYLITTLKDRQLAEDVLQTTWLKAIEALPRFQERGTGIGGWLFAIAKNECRTQWRVAAKTVPFDPIVHDTGIDDREALEHSILAGQILAALSEDDREILRLRYIADLSHDEVAHAMGISSVAARVRIHRALARARKILSSHAS
jgi:RNA polymerase sigma-70 factor, ECF subfamily